MANSGTVATGAGSAAHKAARWSEYQARGGTWSLERWSATYEQNMIKATQANAAVDKYHATLGWGEREITVDAIIDGMAHPRRLDIADVARQRAVEYKTGYQTANEFNLWEIQRDKMLIEQGWNIEWVMRDKASKPLLQHLNEAGLPYKLGK